MVEKVGLQDSNVRNQFRNDKRCYNTELMSLSPLVLNISQRSLLRSLALDERIACRVSWFLNFFP